MIIVGKKANESGWRVERREVPPESIGNTVAVIAAAAAAVIAIITAIITDINCTIQCLLLIIAMRTNSFVLFLGLLLVGCYTFGVTVDAKGERVLCHCLV